MSSVPPNMPPGGGPPPPYDPKMQWRVYREQQRADAGDQSAVDRRAGSPRRALRRGRCLRALRQSVQRCHARWAATLAALDAVALV